MGREIERKFLVTGDGWREQATGSRHMLQAYLALRDTVEVRVRIVDGMEAKLTVKSGDAAVARDEFEYDIPVVDARRMLDLRQGHCIEKRRYIVPREQGRHWEVDIFEGRLKGLRLAEVELEEEEGPVSEHPSWLGEDVTGDERYYNASLARCERPPG